MASYLLSSYLMQGKYPYSREEDSCEGSLLCSPPWFLWLE